MLRIVPVKFHHAGRQYDFNAQNLELKPGARVVVETDRGRALAIVVTAPREVPADQAPEGLKAILRLATDDDLAQAASNAAREKAAVRYCQERVQARNMEMKLVRAEYAFDGSKIVFFFTAEGRIDFRDLVKDLAHYFHTRIEMRQIGVRDEAKLVGGMGICGRELCCCSFLTEFYPVSVKMAKEQGLALNPTKISGQCGRLLCCLGYEFESYCELRKGMPKCGKKVCWDNREWEVTGQNALGRQLTLRQGDGTMRVVTMDEYETGHPRDAEPAAPKAAEPRRQAEPASQRTRPTPPREKTAPVQPPQPPPPADSPVETTGEPATGETEKTGGRRKRRRRRRGNRPSTSGEQGE
ncbi:MAG: stage 0 sporulation family protein [Desulfuromonas sp.]|nr:stage 0 sporulation family protein [Desulfuromonas sp.]